MTEIPYDRLISDEDRVKLFDLLKPLVQKESGELSAIELHFHLEKDGITNVVKKGV